MKIPRRIRLTLGLLFFAVMFIHLGISTYSAILELRKPYDGWIARRSDDSRWKISEVDGEGPAASLRVGDVIVSIAGVRPEDDRRILNYANRVVPGTYYSMVVERDGQVREFKLEIVRRPFFKPVLMWVNVLARKIIYPFIFLLPALVVFLLKPDDKQALLLSLFLGTFLAFMIWTSNTPKLPVWLVFTDYLSGLLGTLFWPVLFHFFLIFPETPPVVVRHPWLERLIYVPYLLTVFPFQLVNRYWLHFNPSLAWTPAAFGKQEFLYFYLGGAGFILIVFYVSGGLLMLVFNYWRAGRISRRKMNVAVFGSVLGFIFLLFLLVAEARFQQIWPWLQLFGLFALPLVPISFMYAIFRHKVIPVSLIIRRGVRYLLVSRGSIVLEVLAVAVIVTFALRAIFIYLNPHPLLIGIFSAIVGIVVWVITRTLHDRYLAPIIDRKFFRQSYDERQILADLAQSLRTTTDLPRLMESVATKIQTALQTECVTVLLRDEASGDYLSGYSCEYSHIDGKAIVCDEKFRLPSFAEAIGQLAEAGQPIEVESNSNGSHLNKMDTLQKMKSSLLLPLTGKEGMLGIVSLGPRLGDLPYSRGDKRLLMSVAGPTTFAIENARLVERMIEEARRRQELEAENEARAKELEEARRLQLSMLPKSVPQLPHLEIAAYMKPATEVGGDYYDFHLSGETLTIAVGDATGHGLNAGTVVTAMKSLFHSFAGEPEVAPLLNRSSRVLKQMNLRSLFMGLTVIKLSGYQLKIASAGMPPVLIYRARERSVEEVLIKAMPLGSISSYTYHERELALFQGDVVVLMSDGFPERFNQHGEMFDYSRAIQSLADAALQSPNKIIEHFVRVSESWANERPQDDDVTFVVVKVR